MDNSGLLEDLLKQTEKLSVADRLLLAARLIENVRREMPSMKTPTKWQDENS